MWGYVGYVWRKFCRELEYCVWGLVKGSDVRVFYGFYGVFLFGLCFYWGWWFGWDYGIGGWIWLKEIGKFLWVLYY